MAIRFKEGFSFVESLDFADVHELEVRLHQTNDRCTMADGEVKVDDGETLWEALHQGEQTRRERMDA